MVLVSDFVFVCEGVVFNFYYKLMKFYGFEYYIYFFLKCVGQEKISELLLNVEFILVLEVVEIGFLDGCVGESVEEFEGWIKEQVLYFVCLFLQKYFV